MSDLIWLGSWPHLTFLETTESAVLAADWFRNLKTKPHPQSADTVLELIHMFGNQFN